MWPGTSETWLKSVFFGGLWVLGYGALLVLGSAVLTVTGLEADVEFSLPLETFALSLMLSVPIVAALVHDSGRIGLCTVLLLVSGVIAVAVIPEVVAVFSPPSRGVC